MLTVVLYLALLVYLSLPLALASIAVLPVVAAASVVYARRTRSAQVAIRDRVSALTSVAEEGLSAIALVKAFARSPFEQGRFDAAATAGYQARLRSIHLRALFTPLIDVVATVGLVLVVWFGAQTVWSGGLTPGGLVAFISYLGALYAPIQALSRLNGVVRQQIAAVLQEPMLFQTSVRDNLRYGRLDASDAEIEAAARAAQAEAFILDLPEGYETQVGPRGARLSGGQRQRLAIARALLKGAPIVVLDEATSALDPLTEADVLRGMRSSLGGSAVLVVAHRISTVRQADRIAFLQDGRVAEMGTHDELLAANGLYASFYRAQVGREKTFGQGSRQVQVALGG
jgi:ABC-type multidrug transport system fused ATPase/permease subunit